MKSQRILGFASKVLFTIPLLYSCAKAPEPTTAGVVVPQQPPPPAVSQAPVQSAAATPTVVPLAPPAQDASLAQGSAAPTVDASADAASTVAAAQSALVLSADDIAAHQMEVDKLCAHIGDKLGSVDTKDCLDQLFHFAGGYSVNKRPLVVKDYMPDDPANREFRVLLLGGVHGDEYSSISIIFKWLALFSPTALEGEFHWRFAPLVNPDGLLDGKQANRQNANGVDLNRNFPSEDWNDTAVAYWQESTGSNPRLFPGSNAASEPEVQWIVEQIVDFQPDVIVSVHAPYHLLDFDGPAEAPRNIGELYLHQLGVYPGSLGNYAGLNKSIPVVTLELPSAGIMPKSDQIALMWKDLVVWLDKEGRSKMPQ